MLSANVNCRKWMDCFVADCTKFVEFQCHMAFLKLNTFWKKKKEKKYKK